MKKLEMETFILSKNKSTITFLLNGPDSSLLIRKITLRTSENNKNLSSIISSLNLSYELKYVVFNDAEDRFIDERKQISPITISLDSCHTQAIFDLNLRINNEKFTVGINPNQKCYTTLKFELIEKESIEQEYELKFEVEPYHIKLKNDRS
jgi:hypothetical protein